MVIPLDTNGLKLSETAIFKGMSEDEIQAAMRVLQAHDRSYKKGRRSPYFPHCGEKQRKSPS